MTDKTISTSDTGILHSRPLKLQDLITLDLSSGCSSGALEPFINLLQQWRRQQAAGLHLATDWDRPCVWPVSVALERSHMWRQKRPKIKLSPFKRTHLSWRTQPARCVAHPGRLHTWPQCITSCSGAACLTSVRCSQWEVRQWLGCHLEVYWCT